ncbi:MAG: head maturation protease, ClpP-related [Syntrophomonas sp.]
MRFWNFVQNEEDLDQVELRITGDIVSDDDAWIYEWFGIEATSPNAFRAALAEYAGKNITVWIDSYGGDVFAAAGIYNALKEHKGKITVKIDGKAMSAASVIAMAGDEILMSPVAILMIHNPLSGVHGYASDMRKAADVLDEVKETIVSAYQIKTGRSRNKISKLMDEETWMSAKKAVSEGFADGILYTNIEEGAPPDVQDSFMFSRMAIQNSTNTCIKHFIEQYNDKFKELPPKEKIEKPINEDEQSGNGLLSLYQAQAKINNNRRY